MKRTLLFLGLLLTLSSCFARERHDAPNIFLEWTRSEDMVVRMAMRVLEESEGEKTIGIVIENPSKVPIQSVRSWVRYDPSSVRAKNLSIADGRFVLFVPGEREIDEEEGLIKIGGAVQSAVEDNEILLATFTVRVLGDSRQRPVLAFYDWRAEGDGHTVIFALKSVGDLEGEDSDRKSVVENVLYAPSSLEL